MLSNRLSKFRDNKLFFAQIVVVVMCMLPTLICASQTFTSTDNSFAGTPTFGAGQTATIAPGINLTFTSDGAMTFNSSSSLIFQVNGMSFGTIDATDPTPSNGVLFDTGSQVIFDVIGDSPADGEYTLIRGYMGVNGTLKVVLRNGGDASISTVVGPLGDAANGYLKVIISGSGGGSFSDIVLNNTNGTTSTVFTSNIQSNVATSSCSTGGSGASFTFSTSKDILKDMSRFVARTQQNYSRFMAIKPMSGAGPRSVDMMKVLSEGQLPQTQIDLKNLGTRIWMTGIYNYAVNNLDRQHYTADSRGFQFGLDSVNTPVPIGVSFAYIATKPRLNHMRLGLSRSTQFGLYGGYLFNNIMTFGSLSYGHGHNKLQRLSRKQHFSTNSFGAYGMASYLYYISKKNLLESIVNFNYGHTWVPQINSFSNDVKVSTTRSRENNNFSTQLGLRFNHYIISRNENVGPVKLFAQVLWSHNYTNKLKRSQVQLAQGQLISGGSGQRQAKNTADLGAGVIVRKCDLDFSLTAGSSFARKSRNYSGMAGVRMPL